MRVEQLAQRVFALAPNRVVDMRSVEGGLGADRRKVAAPDDRHRRRGRPQCLRKCNRGSQLWTAHDTDTNSVDAPAGDGLERGGDKVPIDIAVDERGVVVPFQARREIQDGQRKPGAAPRGDRGIDQEDLFRGAHDSFCTGTSQRASSISTGRW